MLERKLRFFNSHCNDNFSSPLMISCFFSTFLFPAFLCFLFQWQQISNSLICQCWKRTFRQAAILKAERINTSEQQQRRFFSSFAICHCGWDFSPKKKGTCAESNLPILMKESTKESVCVYSAKKTPHWDGKKRGEKQQKFNTSFFFTKFLHFSIWVGLPLLSKLNTFLASCPSE